MHYAYKGQTRTTYKQLNFLVSELKVELGEASEKGDIEKVKRILEKVTNTDVKIKREGLGKSPLLIACTYGQTPVVDELLQVLL